MQYRTAMRVHSLARKTSEATGMLHRKGSLPLILGVCGGSGSGKTTFTKELAAFLGDDKVCCLSQDYYYRDLSHLSLQQRSQINFDHPDSVEFELLETHLDHLTSGLDIAVPHYDFATHTRLGISHILSPKPIIVLEGILLFANSNLFEKIHRKIFVHTQEQERFQRRLRRDVQERGRTPESVWQQITSSVQPMHNLFVEPYLKSADIVISGEEPFPPAIAKLCREIFEEIMSAL